MHGASDEHKRETWFEVLSAKYLIEWNSTSGRRQPFSASMQVRTVGAVTATKVDTSGGFVVRRTSRTIAERPMDSVFVFQQINPTGSVFSTWKGRRGGELATGDLVIGSGDETWESMGDSEFGHRIWVIPARLVMPFAQNPSELEAGVWLRAQDPCNVLISTYLTEFTRHGPRMRPEVAEVFAGNIGRLLSVASVPPDDLLRSAEAGRLGRLAKIKQEIETRLADPLLSPGRIAEALGLGLRTLHATFAPTGETCAAYITRRRLEEARALVVGAPWRSISDIAFGLGFNSMGTFFRTYRGRFGETPTESRRRDSAAAE